MSKRVCESGVVIKKNYDNQRTKPTARRTTGTRIQRIAEPHLRAATRTRDARAMVVHEDARGGGERGGLAKRSASTPGTNLDAGREPQLKSVKAEC